MISSPGDLPGRVLAAAHRAPPSPQGAGGRHRRAAGVPQQAGGLPVADEDRGRPRRVPRRVDEDADRPARLLLGRRARRRGDRHRLARRRATRWARTGASRWRAAEAEIGYILDPAYAGQGYATEIAAALLRICFEDLGVHRRDGRLLRRQHRLAPGAGEGRHAPGAVRRHSDSWHAELGWIDGCTYALLAEEWIKAAALHPPDDVRAGEALELDLAGLLQHHGGVGVERLPNRAWSPAPLRRRPGRRSGPRSRRCGRSSRRPG